MVEKWSKIVGIDFAKFTKKMGQKSRQNVQRGTLFHLQILQIANSFRPATKPATAVP